MCSINVNWLCKWINVCVLSCFSCVWLLAILWTVAHQAPLSMGFSRQEYWSGWPCPPLGDLPDPGTEPTSLTSPALQACSLPLAPLGKPKWISNCKRINNSSHQLLYTECLCPTKIPMWMLKPNPHCDDIWRWGLWDIIRSWRQNLRKWD